MDLPFEYGFELYRIDPDLTQTFTQAWTSGGNVNIEPDPATGKGVLNGLGAKDEYVFTAPDTGRLAAQVTCPDRTCPIVEVSELHGSWPSPLDARWADVRAGHSYRVSVSGGVGGPHSYSLHLGLTQPFDYALGDTVTSGSHGPGSGAWEALGEPDLYRFSVPEGGADIGLQLSGVPGWAARLMDDSGAEVLDWSSFNSPGVRHLDAGTYTLRVTSEQDPGLGEYSFRLFDVPDPEVLPLAVGTPADPAPMTGSLETTAATDEYTFDIDTPGDYTIELQGDVGVEFLEAPSTDPDSWVNPAAPRFHLNAGTHRIRITAGPGAGYSFDGLDYSLSLRSAAPVDTLDYTLGSLIDSSTGGGLGTLNDWSDADQIQFDVPEGGMNLAFIVSGLPDPCSQMSLTDGAGTPLSLDCEPIGWGQRLDEGAYTLTIDQGWEDHGRLDYRLRIAAPETAAPVTINPGTDNAGVIEVVDGTVSEDGAVTNYTFSLSEYQLAATPYLQIEPGDGCAQYRVFHNDNLIGNANCTTWSTWAETGTYRLEVTGKSATHYQFLVYSTAEPDWNGGGGSS